MTDIKQWYFTQPLSSRILLACAALMMLIFMLFEFAFDPWKNHLDNTRQRVNNTISTVAWMEGQYQENQSLINRSIKQPQNKTKSLGSLITRIEQSAKKQKIYSNIARITPDKVGRVKVWLNNGNFQQWLVWVEALKREGIDVVNARVNQSPQTSIVSITSTFSDAGL